MIVLQTHRLSKSFGGEPILSDVNLEIQSGERVGVVGANGAGKSTLMKILAGELSYDRGDIFAAKEMTIGYLAQNSGLDSSATIWEEMRSVFADLIQEEQKLRKMERQMADPGVLNDPDRYETLMQEYARAADTFKARGGYAYEARIRNVLHGLRFADKDRETPVSTLSGGQKTRLALGKHLLCTPDLLLLDEPTNYLDLETMSWLEQHLQHFPGAVLVVSHDRYFLDHIATTIYEIERTKGTAYKGNYSRYVELKQSALEQQVKAYEKQRKDIQTMEEFVQKNIARASTSNRAKSRRKALEKMERLERPDGDLKSAFFSFTTARPSGQDVLKAEEVTIGYESKQPLAKNIQLHAYKGDRIAIVGPNGVGKTTFLKTILGQLPPLAGNVQKGANVSISYYDQEQDALDGRKTVLSHIWDDYPHMPEKDVRGLLGQFLFSGDNVQKRITDLSGGEKARLSLAHLMLEKANLLILDEPTNHLDLKSKEVLEQALLDYPGTMLFVSHDRFFLNRIATKIVELSSNGTTLYLGNYDYYMAKKSEEQEIEALQQEKMPAADAAAADATDASAAVETSEAASSPSGQSAADHYVQEKERQRTIRKQQRRKQQLEEHIEQIERELEDLEQQLLLPDNYEDYSKANNIQKQIDSRHAQLDALLEEWSELEEQLDD